MIHAKRSEGYAEIADAIRACPRFWREAVRREHSNQRLCQKSGITLSDSPSTFNEIRSLAGRMYEKEYGREFTQKLLGHTTEKVTQKYLDSRKKEFI